MYGVGEERPVVVKRKDRGKFRTVETSSRERHEGLVNRREVHPRARCTPQKKKKKKKKTSSGREGVLAEVPSRWRQISVSSSDWESPLLLEVSLPPHFSPSGSFSLLRAR